MNKQYLDQKTHRIFNFYPGPSMLPTEVLHRISDDLYSWKNLGLNPMEIGHRTKHFIELHQNIISKLKSIMNISDDYEVLLMQGGATAQYAAIPLNLMSENQGAGYVICGHWSHKASLEFKKMFGSDRLSIVADAEKLAFKSLPDYSTWNLNSIVKTNKPLAYVYYTANETINGLAYRCDPNENLSSDEIAKLPPLVCDYTSSLLTQPTAVERYGLIFASSQKCLGISGVTLVVVKKDLLSKASSWTPSVLDYTKASQQDSMLNTPVTFSWYVMDLVLDWLIQNGGVNAIHQANLKKANLIYDYLDQSDFYSNDIDESYRSLVNICFNIQNPELESLFVQEAEKVGLVGLKGHREVGGLRASLYNAMPLAGAVALVEFMQTFEKKHG